MMQNYFIFGDEERRIKYNSLFITVQKMAVNNEIIKVRR